MANEPLALSTPPQLPADGDYEAICAELRQTERGQRFLEECARRSRNGDAKPVTDAIGLSEPMTDARPNMVEQVSAAAERLQDLAWRMREHGLDLAVCEQLEGLASAILAAPSLRALGTHRAQKLGEVIGYLERRIEGMIKSAAAGVMAMPSLEEVPHSPNVAGEPEPGEFLLESPPLTSRAARSAPLGNFADSAPVAVPGNVEGIDEELFAAPPAAAVKPVPAPSDAQSQQRMSAMPPATRSDPLAALNALSDAEKIALFT
jgi:hypothetical protein